MGHVIATNVSAGIAHRHLSAVQAAQGSTLERLSSGLRINRAADDAAGMSIAEGLRSQVRGLEQAGRNAHDAISMIQVADGGLADIHAMLHRIRDLAVQAANDTNTAESRQALQDESAELGKEIKRLHDGVNFNGLDILGNSPTYSFQVGADGDRASTIAVTFPNVTGAVASVVSTGDARLAIDFTGGGDPDQAAQTSAAAIERVDRAIGLISGYRSYMGAAQNRIEYAYRTTLSTGENLAAAESRVRDTDMAREMTALSHQSILVQAGTSMLAQANQSGSGVLELLG